MTTRLNKIEIYLEAGSSRTFAGAVDWPGWCRSGRDEGSAIQNLLVYGPRYAPVAHQAGLEFDSPAALETLVVVERLPGNTSTDFGTPNLPLARDQEPVGEAELQRYQAIVQACWQILDFAAAKAAGKELVKGPRGGGRELDQIVKHVWEAERAYLSRIGVKLTENESHDLAEELRHTRQAVLAGLAQAARGETPAQGPRGGVRWSARTFVRRVAWHILDHAWEIEDRIQ